MRRQISKAISRVCRRKETRYICYLYVLTFCLVLPLLCQNLQHSVYFVRRAAGEKAKVDMKSANDKRLEWANWYLEQLLEDTNPIPNLRLRNHSPGREMVDVVVTVITVSRNRHVIDSYEPRFLTQVVARLLFVSHMSELHGDRPQNIAFALCNVDMDPASYEEAKRLNKFLPTFQRFNKTHFSLIHPLEKEKQDYMFCLNASVATFNPRFVFLLEDDAYPQEDFFSLLNFAIQKHLEKKYSIQGTTTSSTDINTTAYVKLYHPERLLGYFSGGYVQVLELIAISCLIATLASLLLQLLQQPASNEGKWINLVLLFLFGMGLQICVGRPHLLPLRHYFPPHFYAYIQAPSCCTPAMLFPRHQISSLIADLNKVTCGEKGLAKDSALEQIVKTRGLKTSYVIPNAVTHIGFYSAVRENIVDPFLV